MTNGAPSVEKPNLVPGESESPLERLRRLQQPAQSEARNGNESVRPEKPSIADTKVAIPQVNDNSKSQTSLASSNDTITPDTTVEKTNPIERRVHEVMKSLTVRNRTVPITPEVLALESNLPTFGSQKAA